MKTVYVKDYVKLPCEDAAEGIRRAFLAAKDQKADSLVFEAGVYPLKSFVTIETDQAQHDVEPETSHRDHKDVHILAEGLENIMIAGQADREGRPATVLEGYNSEEQNCILPSVLWVDGGRNITIRNLKFRRNPEFGSAGRVLGVDNGCVLIFVSEGNPCYDEMGTYCMNRFSEDGETLVGESLSYGRGLGSSMKLTGDRLLLLENREVAGKVRPGDMITWHQGARTDFQCFFGNVDRLTLENLHTSNSNGFAHLAFYIRDLTIRKVRFQPEGNQLFTAPRDAFKLHKCRGRIRVEEMHVEGVRMDGQNIHSNYLFPVEVLSDNCIRLFSRHASESGTACFGTVCWEWIFTMQRMCLWKDAGLKEWKRK